jgi:hypothetical protein
MNPNFPDGLLGMSTALFPFGSPFALELGFSAIEERFCGRGRRQS